MTPVIPMKDDLPGWPSHNDDDFIFETYGQPQEVNVEGFRLVEVADVQDQAVEIGNVHIWMLARGVCPPAPFHRDTLPGRWAARRSRVPHCTGGTKVFVVGGEPLLAHPEVEVSRPASGDDDVGRRNPLRPFLLR